MKNCAGHKPTCSCCEADGSHRIRFKLICRSDWVLTRFQALAFSCRHSTQGLCSAKSLFFSRFFLPSATARVCSRIFVSYLKSRVLIDSLRNLTMFFFYGRFDLQIIEQGDTLHFKPFAMSGRDEARIFVGGLSWETTDRQLEDAFSRFGKVVEAQV